MTKIMIDAGHGGADPGAVYNGRQEKDDNLNLALAVGRILEEDGYEVEYTRTKDLYQTPYEKAELGNGSGGGSVCVHSPQFQRISRSVQRGGDPCF